MRGQFLSGSMNRFSMHLSTSYDVHLSDFLIRLVEVILATHALAHYLCVTGSKTLAHAATAVRGFRSCPVPKSWLPPAESLPTVQLSEDPGSASARKSLFQFYFCPGRLEDSDRKKRGEPLDRGGCGLPVRDRAPCRRGVPRFRVAA